MGCGQSSVASDKGSETTTAESKEPENAPSTVKKEKKEAKRRRSASGLLENMVHEEFDKDISEYYEVKNSHILGEGISGQVRVCTHRHTKTSYALKTLRKDKLKKEELLKLREEVRIMASLDHPNILRVHECFEDEHSIKLILALCQGGELLDRLHHQTKHKYTEKVACRYILSMVKAVRYLHDHNIVHRDLKLENFLFETDSDESELILIDFGLSQIYYPNEVILNPVGTPYYVAPEVLNGAYGNKCDVWSLGVIAFMLVSGTPPFYGKTDNDTLRAVQKGTLKFDPKLFDCISMECKDFIRNCLNRHVTHRPTAAELIDHAWFKDLNEASHAESPSLNVMTRLVLYNERSMLTKVCMEVVAHTLDTEQIASLRKQFQALDTNNRGEILFSDLKNILHRDNKISAANMDIMLKSSKDAPPDMVIKYHEFLASTISRQQINDNNMRVAFEKMSNHSSVINHSSILDLLGKNASDDTVSKMMLEVNVDPDGDITFDQFKEIMKGGPESPVVNSPMNKFRKRMGTHGPGIVRGSSGGNKATPLNKLAMKNAYSRSQSPPPPGAPKQANTKNVSPIRPQTLEFGGANI